MLPVHEDLAAFRTVHHSESYREWANINDREIEAYEEVLLSDAVRYGHGNRAQARNKACFQLLPVFQLYVATLCSMHSNP